jgi:anaerobic selenocysteine-containing dehydrogenase
VIDMLTDQTEDGDRAIPRIIYIPTPACLEMVAYADLILPDTTYLESRRISLLDRLQSGEVTPSRRDPLARRRTDRDVRAFQLCLRSGRLDSAWFQNDDGSAKYADYADYITHHLRRWHRPTGGLARKTTDWAGAVSRTTTS